MQARGPGPITWIAIKTIAMVLLSVACAPSLRTFHCGEDEECQAHEVCDAGDCMSTDGGTCPGPDCAGPCSPSVPLPSAQQEIGDCRIICEGDGGGVSITDETDPPDDGNDCTADLCSGTVPEHLPRTEGTMCGPDGTGLCDSAGKCKYDNGQSCSSDEPCLSGFCVDGVCCNNTCTATCLACNLPSTMGTCTYLPSGTQDGFAAQSCTASRACDGFGGCLLKAGETCIDDTECLSGTCAGSPKLCQP
jgi:hypothetical protein